MELRHLRYVVAVADLESVSAAAARLRVAQPALSRQLADVEREIGAPLFARSWRGARLTPAGEAFLVHARAALADADRAVAAARRAAGVPPTAVRLTVAYHTQSAPAVAAALARARAADPALAAAVEPPGAALADALRERRADVALDGSVDPADYGEGLAGARLAEDPMDVALLPPAHPLAASGQTPLRLADLAALPFLLCESRLYGTGNGHVLAALRARGLDPEVVPTPSGRGVVGTFGLVGAGAGWALAPHSMLAAPPFGVVARALADVSVRFGIDVLWRADEAHALVHATVDALRGTGRGDATRDRTDGTREVAAVVA